MNIEEEWENFCNNDKNSYINQNPPYSIVDNISNKEDVPKCSDIYIYKTKIIYL